MPGVLTPAAAARMELTSTEDVVVSVEDRSELTEETVLMKTPEDAANRIRFAAGTRRRWRLCAATRVGSDVNY
jgi:hypothetical protein